MRLFVSTRTVLGPGGNPAKAFPTSPSRFPIRHPYPRLSSRGRTRNGPQGSRVLKILPGSFELARLVIGIRVATAHRPSLVPTPAWRVVKSRADGSASRLRKAYSRPYLHSRKSVQPLWYG